MEEKAFRDLIQSTGYESAPDGMVSSVLEQIESKKARNLSSVPSLISKRTWILIGAALICLIIYSFQSSPSVEFSLIAEFLQKIQVPEINLRLPENINLIGNTPKFLIVIIPVLIVQFYLIKNYSEGRFL
jgi:hypothetical protein